MVNRWVHGSLVGSETPGFPFVTRNTSAPLGAALACSQHFGRLSAALVTPIEAALVTSPTFCPGDVARNVSTCSSTTSSTLRQAQCNAPHSAFRTPHFPYSCSPPPSRYSTPMRTATPLVTWSRITERSPSATLEASSMPRLMGPGCMMITSLESFASLSRSSP